MWYTWVTARRLRPLGHRYIVPGEGIGPTYWGPKPQVLPLDDPAIIIRITPLIMFENKENFCFVNDLLIIKRLY